MLLQRQLPAFNGVQSTVSSGQKVTVTSRLTIGDRVHVIWLEFGGVSTSSWGALGSIAAPGMIDEIRIVVDGKVQRRMTAVELNYINSLMNSPGLTQYSAKVRGTATSGSTNTRTLLPIYLAEPWRKGFVTTDKGLAVPEAELSAWNLAGIESCVIEVDMFGRNAAGTNADVTSAYIAGFYEYDSLTANDLGSIVKWKRQSLPATANPSEITSLDKKTGAYQSIHLFATVETTPCYVSSVMFTRNNVQVRQDITRAQNDACLQSRNMSPAQGATSTLTPVDTTSATTVKNTGVYNIVFDYDDPIRNLLGVDGANELTLKASFETAPGTAGTPTVGMVAISQIAGTRD